MLATARPHRLCAPPAPSFSPPAGVQKRGWRRRLGLASHRGRALEPRGRRGSPSSGGFVCRTHFIDVARSATPPHSPSCVTGLTKNVSDIRKKHGHQSSKIPSAHLVTNQTADKSLVNQPITSCRPIFCTHWQTLARPLPYGNHAAAFAELTKSRFGEGN